jgi:hypothetical protein
MANSPPASAGPPKTLFEARNEIARLREKLGSRLITSSPAGSRPIPGKVDTQPVGGSQPVPKTPEDPHPVPARTEPINPENLNAKVLAALVESRSTADLFKMIRKSNNGRIMAAIRKELGNRNAA